MRSSALAAAAAVVLALPAATQPHPEPARILLGALERVQQNVPAHVASYLVTFTYGSGLRAQLYVARRGDRWEVVEQKPRAVPSMLVGMVIWPPLADQFRPGLTAAGVAAAQPGLRYLGEEAVGGRATHALMIRVPGLRLGAAELPDTVRVRVDAETRQVLRVGSSVEGPPAHDDPHRRSRSADAELTLDGYESINGVTLPRRWHIRVAARMDLTDAERQAMRDQADRMTTTGTAEQIADMRMMIDLQRRTIDGEPMELTATVEDVQVNPPRPRWAGGNP